MAEATVYPCPQCGAPLAFDVGSGKLACEFCGGSYTVEEVETIIDESKARKEAMKDARELESEKPVDAQAAALAAEKQAENKSKKTGSKKKESSSAAPEMLAAHTMEEWDRLIASGSLAYMENVVGYTCHNCGAQVVTDPLTVAASCQYCGSNVAVDQRLSGALRPDYVIPFKIKADDLAGKLQNFYSKRPLLPKNFFHQNQVGEVQGLYVPFWLYGGTIAGEGSYKTSKIRCYVSGDYDVTETTRYECERVGDVSFKGVPVDASERIDDDLMDSIEPFDYKDLKPFQAGYLTGFVAERFDQNPRQVFDRAGDRMKLSATQVFRNDLPGTQVDSSNAKFAFSGATASYVMLPVYLFNCKYGGKLYRYAVNGQTGKIVGEVPIGKRESLIEWLKGWAIGAVGGIAVTALLAFSSLID